MANALAVLFERGLAQLLASAMIRHRRVYDFILLSDLKEPYMQAARVLPVTRPLTSDLADKALAVLKMYDPPMCIRRNPEDYAVCVTWRPIVLGFARLSRVQWIN